MKYVVKSVKYSVVMHNGENRRGLILNSDRHLNRREVFNENRTDALAEWHEISACLSD